MIGTRTSVEVIFTKWDLVIGELDNNKLKNFIKRIEQEFMENFGERIGSLQIFKVAARPISPILPFGYELDKIFPLWVESVHTRSYYQAYQETQHQIREFDRYSFQPAS